MKYIVALIGIFVAGVPLNMWQAPQLASNLTSQLGLSWDQIVSVVMPFIYLLGLTNVLPITIGFVIGLIIAVVK